MHQATIRMFLMATSAGMFATGVEAQVVAGPTASPAAAPESPNSQDIVVTAQHRSERLQDVPVAVSAFRGDQLQRLNINSSDQLAKITPGLVFTQSSFTPQAQIRGVGTRGLSAGEESTVPLYVDGIYQPYLLNSLFALSDVERVEVLKGPQSALYGRNATGGAINVVTLEPTAGFHARLGLRYARFNDTEVNGYVSGGSDTIAAGLSGVFSRRDGYIRDIVTNTDRGYVRNFMGRGKVVWTPSDKFKAKLVAAYGDSLDELSSLGTPIDGNTSGRRYTPTPLIPTAPYTTALGKNIPNAVKTTNIGLTGSYDLGFATLNAIASYARLKQDYSNNNPTATTAPYYLAFINYSSRSTYDEVYLVSKHEKLFNWIVGGTYYHDNTFYPRYSITSVNVATNVATLTTNNNRITADSKALYAQGTINLTNNLSVTAAGRYTDEVRGFYVRNYQAGSPINRPAPINLQTSIRYKRFTPSGNIALKISRNLNVYVKAGKAFKSGVYSAGGSSLVAAKPESVTQYEIGLKSEPFSWLTANIAAYYSDYAGLQAVARDPVTQAPILQNAASSTIKGLELELLARPSRGLSLQSSLAISRGNYDKFPSSQVTIPATSVDPGAAVCAYGTGTPIGGNRTPFCDVSGNNIIKLPRVTFNISGTKTWNIGDTDLALTANLQYQSHFYWDTLNRIKEPARALVDAELAWTFSHDRITVGIFGQNLTNRLYNFSVLSSANVDLAQPALPRTVGMRVGLKI